MKKCFLTVLFAVVATMGLQAQIIKPGQEKKVAQSIKNGFDTVIEAIDQDTKPTGTHDVLDGYFYPKLGLNLSTLTSMGGNVRLGLTGGFGVELFVHSRMAVGMEVLYSHQGTGGVYYQMEDKDGQPYEYGPCKYTYNYLSTNFTARYYPKATLPLSVYSGLCISRCVGAKFKSDSENVDLYDGSHVRKGDLGIPLGATYEVGQWAFDLRYTFSPLHQARSQRAKELMGNASHMKLEATVAYRILVF